MTESTTPAQAEEKKQATITKDMWWGIKKPWYLLGPTFLLAIFFWVHYELGLVKLVGGLSFQDFVCVFSCLMVVVFLAFGGLKKTRPHRARATIVGLVCGVVSMLCIALSEVLVTPFGIIGIVGAFLFAFYMIAYWLLWLGLFVRQSIMMTLVYVFLSTALGHSFAWIILGLDSIRAISVLVGMVVLSALFLLRGLRKCKDILIAPEKGEGTYRLPVGLILISFAFSASYMYAIMDNGLQFYHSVFTWDLPVFSLVLLALAFLVRRKLTLVRLFSLAAPLMIVGLLLTLFIDFSGAFRFNFFHLGYYIYLIFILIIFCGCVQERGDRAFPLACNLILAVFIGCFVGRLLHPALVLLFADRAEQLFPVVSITIIGLLVICTLYGIQSIHRLFDRAVALPSFETLSAADEEGLEPGQIAALYNLSERESEVLQLLLQRKSATQIAEEMVVAHGTIKAHTRNIYKKIGIHQREELFALAQGTRRR